jgi:hypothetical protein
MYKEEIEENIKVSLTIKCDQENDYVKLGSSTFKKDSEGKRYIMKESITPSGSDYFGYIPQNKTEDLCYTIKPINEEKIPTEDDLLFVTGTIFTNVAEVYYYNKNSHEETGRYPRYNGYILNTLNYETIKSMYYCIRRPSLTLQRDNIKDIAFYIQATDISRAGIQSLTSPQQFAELYPKILKKGEIGVYYGITTFTNYTKINYVMNAVSGFPIMYFDQCETFPFCGYVTNDKSEKSPHTKQLSKTIHPHNTNRMTRWEINTKESKSPIDKKQNVIIVYCSDGSQFNRTTLDEQYCRFQIGFYSDIDRMKLIPRNIFSQYLSAKNSQDYRINYVNLNPSKIYIDLFIHSGDIDLKLNSILYTLNHTVHQYSVGNKIFYSITIERTNNEMLKELTFSVHAAKKNILYFKL